MAKDGSTIESESEPPSTIDGAAIEVKSPRELRLKPASPVQTPVSEKKVGKKLVVKAKESESDWQTSDFQKDPTWFASNCGLPNSGDAPHKVAYITEDELQACFGKESRNGYKLNACTGIPVEDVLALSQVIDGYDKPVNGVLSHTFVKGVYAERILKKKIDWASYASSKLRGQLSQHERDGKGKPDGPPCVRKPRMYIEPLSSFAQKADGKNGYNDSKVIPPGMGAAIVEYNAVSNWNIDCGLEAASSYLEQSPRLSIDAPKGPQAYEATPVPHLLISTLKLEISKMQSRDEENSARLRRVDQSLAWLKSVQLEGLTTESTLSEQCKSLEKEVMRIEEQLVTEDNALQDLSTDIELELNKHSESDEIGEVNNQLVTMLEDKQNQIGETIEHLKSLLEVTKKDLESTRGVIVMNQKKLQDLPETFRKLNSVAHTLEADKLKLDVNLKAQQTEWSILSPIFDKPILPLNPYFTVTSTQIAPSSYSISSCPVCCFGYLDFNWIPASCGHAYHPACLFHLISNSKEAPKCMSCAELFTRDWLHTWGLGGTWDVENTPKLHATDDMATHMKDVYGKNSSRLQKWRLIASNLNKEVQGKGSLDTNAEECLQSVLPSSTIDLTEDDREDRLLKVPLLTPKLEKDEGDKRKIIEIDSGGRKVKPMFRLEPGHFTPYEYFLSRLRQTSSLSHTPRSNCYAEIPLLLLVIDS